MEISRDLARYIYDRRAAKRLLLYRNGAELEFLRKWLFEDNDSAGTGEEEKPGPVEELILGCNKCGSIYNKKPGFGSGGNGVFIILNKAGAGIEADNEIIKKQSVDLLKNMIKAMKMDYNECYITNLIKCESRDSLNRPSQMFRNCENNLICELEEKQPRAVIVMGSILPLKKIIADYENVSWYNIEHPAAIVRDPNKKRPAWEVLKNVMSQMKE